MSETAKCATCRGRGFAGGNPYPCAACNGSGQAPTTSRTRAEIVGIALAMQCPFCKSKVHFVEDPRVVGYLVHDAHGLHRCAGFNNKALGFETAWFDASFLIAPADTIVAARSTGEGR